MNKSGRAEMRKHESMARYYNDFLWFQRVIDHPDGPAVLPDTQVVPSAPQSDGIVSCAPPATPDSPVVIESPESDGADAARMPIPDTTIGPSDVGLQDDDETVVMPQVPNRRALWEGMVRAQVATGQASFRLRESVVHSGRFSAWQNRLDPHLVQQAPQVREQEKSRAVESWVSPPLESMVTPLVVSDSKPETSASDVVQTSTGPAVESSVLLGQFARQKKGDDRPKTVFDDPMVVERFAVRPKPEHAVTDSAVTVAQPGASEGLSLEAWIGLSVEALSKLSAMSDKKTAVEPVQDARVVQSGRREFPFRPWGEQGDGLDGLQEVSDQDDLEDDALEELAEEPQERRVESPPVWAVAGRTRSDVVEEKWVDDDPDDAALEAELAGPFFFQTMVLPNEPASIWDDFPVDAPGAGGVDEGFEFDFDSMTPDQKVQWEPVVSDQLAPWPMDAPRAEPDAVAESDALDQPAESADRLIALDESAEEMPPVVEEVLPVVEEVLPVVEEVLPVDEEVLPVDEEVAPVAEEILPVAEEVAPVAEEILPVDEEVAPVVEEIPPVVEEVAAVAEKIAPVAKPTPPVDHVEQKRQQMLAEILQLSDTVGAVKVEWQADRSPQVESVVAENAGRKAVMEQMFTRSPTDAKRGVDRVEDQDVEKSPLSKVSAVPPWSDGEFWEEIPVEGLSRGLFHIIGDGFGLIARSVKSMVSGRPERQ